MTAGPPARRLDAAEIKALQRASRRQLQRYDKTALDSEDQQRRAELKRALGVLRHFGDGCELHPIRDES